MRTVYSLKTFELAFQFYKKFLFASSFLSLVFFFPKKSLLLILAMKFLLLALLLICHAFNPLKQKLIFYKNFGMSSWRLFLTSFLIDALITSLLVFILKQF
jgi:hypothetical protein